MLPKYSLLAAVVAWMLLAADIGLAQEELPPPPESSDARVEPAFRLWSDASGSREAKAKFVRLAGQTVHLLKPNGKSSVIALRELSLPDGGWRRADMHGRTRSPGRETSRLSSALPKVPGLSTVGAFFDRLRDRVMAGPRNPSAEGSDSASSQPMSAYLVWARVSREFLESYTTGAVQWRSRVDDNILGTSLAGTAHTQGNTRLVLKPGTGQALAELIFSGRIDSQTTGYNGPIIARNSARTQIEARKPLVLGPAGLQTLPGQYWARTWSTTHDIDTWLPRLRGRIATRIGWRRADEMRPQANAIASQHATQRLDHTIDGRISQAASTLRAALENPLRRLPYIVNGAEPKLHFRSTSDYVDVVLYRADATHDEQRMKPPSIEGEPGLAVRVNRAVIERAMKDPEVQKTIEPLVAALLKQRAQLTVPAANPGQKMQVRLSGDRQWLLVDFTPGGRAVNRPPANATTPRPHDAQARAF